MRGCEVEDQFEKPAMKVKAIYHEIPLPSECSPHLPLLDLVADDLPPLLNDVYQDITLLQELALLTGRVHLGSNSPSVLDELKRLTKA